MLKKLYVLFILTPVFILAACSKGQVLDGEDMVRTLESESIQINQESEMEKPQVPVLVIKTENATFYADLEDNSSTDALVEKLSSGEMTIDLHDYGSFEKVGSLPWDLPRNDETITTQPGDVILYQGNQITIYYDENTWDFTRLAKIPDVTREDLLDKFGDEGVSATFSIEWRQ